MKIRKESLSSRCELCHKDDCFDPVSNHCSRCGTQNDIYLESKDSTPGRKKPIYVAKDSSKTRLIFLISLLLFVLSFYFAFYFAEPLLKSSRPEKDRRVSVYE